MTVPLPKSGQPRQQPPTVAIALMFGLMITIGFFGLITVVIPGAAMMLATGLGLCVFFVLQYFLWGRPLHRYVVEQERKRVATAASGEFPEQ